MMWVYVALGLERGISFDCFTGNTLSTRSMLFVFFYFIEKKLVENKSAVFSAMDSI